ncbi:hypothetical protein KO500_09355 [Cellulophaga baltica]|uniref:EF-Tu C-terminal domain-related protein n=1 Tax=Cellulophaga TaxID=104264 RepID=UPI001C0655C2|nr:MULTISPECIES: hypothetical protein [Cellulophaga]MBU2996642.1 hypothetical protein [Cellulophaga baltica]MDO6768036.1 hypothetical protein [Cellulophaga sp. 1_MG-2023]
MSFETRTPDFIAELKYRTTEEGGRRTPASSGYRPHVKFPFSKTMTSGQQTFIRQDSVNPGETVKAEIMILSPQFFENMLEIGMEFEVGEGSHVVATGKLIEILNTDLIKGL